MKTAINVRDLTENARPRAFHLQILAVCFATAVVDGLDTQVIGFTAPAIATALNLPISAFGAVFAAGTFATVVGGMILGMLADRTGRRPALIACTLLFGVLTLAIPFISGSNATMTTELVVLRALGGLGLGGAMPGFVTLASEYTPKSRNALAIGIVWCGYPVGGVIGALVGSDFVPRFGWTSMFYIGGLLGLAVAFMQILFIPESLQFLASTKTQVQDRMRSLARRIAPETDFSQVEFTVDTRVAMESSGGFRAIFTEGRATTTVLLWVTLFCTFQISNFFVLWAPALFKMGGLSISAATLMVALNNFGAVGSQPVSGHLIDKIGTFRLVPATFACFAIMIGIISFSLDQTAILAVCMVFIGILQGPCIIGLVALAPSLYASNIRSTGVGWALGVGRLGGVLGSIIIGRVVADSGTPHAILLTMCAVPLVAMAGVLLLGVVNRSPRRDLATQPAAELPG